MIRNGLLSLTPLILSLSMNAANAAPNDFETLAALPERLSDSVLSALRGRGALIDPDDLGNLTGDGSDDGDDDGEIGAALIEIGDDNDDDEADPNNLIDLLDSNDDDTVVDGRGGLIEVGDDDNLEDGTVIDLLDDPGLIQLFGNDLLGDGLGDLGGGGFGDIEGLLILDDDGGLFGVLGGDGL
jgi:hypothetical protein